MPSYLFPPYSCLGKTLRRTEKSGVPSYVSHDRVDQETGRVFSQLTNAGGLENTLIVFVSDNGACHCANPYQ